MKTKVTLLVIVLAILGCGIISYQSNGILRTRVFIADERNHRILIFKDRPEQTFQVADAVMGQDTLALNTANRGLGLVTANGFNRTTCVYTDCTRLLVCDYANHRVLIWNSLPDPDNIPAPDVVVGQPNFSQNTFNNGGADRGLRNPVNAVMVNGRLYIADQLNNRILGWHSIPTTNYQPPDFVLGQSSLTGVTANAGLGTVTQLGFSSPSGVSTDGTRLMVVELSNNRALIWNTLPTTTGQLPDIVLGQPDFTQNTANNGGISARTINFPLSSTIHGGKIFISDAGNKRVLIYNSIPSTSFAAADVVVGQANFTAAVTAVNEYSVGGPINAIVVGERLMVTDVTNHRVLFWNSVPTTDYQPANFVLGQPDFSSSGANSTGISGKSLFNTNHSTSVGSCPGVWRKNGY